MSNMINTKRGCGDDGMAVVLVALLLIVLMVMSAMVLDVGAVYNHRRQDQSAADSAALAAAASLSEAPSELAIQAKKYAHGTLGMTLSNAAWDSCPAIAGWTGVSGTSCVSVKGLQVRVRMPMQAYGTSFGRVVGIDSIEHTAFAIAGLRPAGFGGVLPFAVTGASGSGGFGCLKSNSNGQAQPWCGSSSGNFGFLDFGQFGNDDLNTTKSCGNGEFNTRVRNNIAIGADHDLSLYGGDPHGASQVVDTVACNSNPQGSQPNSAETQTGNNSDDVRDGIFSDSMTFSDGGPARLRRSAPQLFNGNGASPVTVHGVSKLDDNPLWQFIPKNYGPGETASANIPASCKRDQFVDTNDNYTLANLPSNVQSHLASYNQRDRVLLLLQRCFDHYQGNDWSGAPLGSSLSPAEASSGCTAPCNDPVFARDDTPNEQPNLVDLQYTPRFGYVPQISAFPNGKGTVRFVRFRPIFIQRLFIERPGTDTIWDPGVTPAPSTSGSYQTVGEVSVFVFPDGMLPNGLAAPEAPFEINKNRFISLIR